METLKKRKLKKGEQSNYSLINNTNSYFPFTTSDSNIKHTMSSVPRNQANVEVEGGETVVGDVNNDGYLEHFTFVGNKHSQGGIPVFLPDAFIFSDTDKLRITDPDILKYFGMSVTKKGHTPASISKKYKINEYMDVLKDEDADDLAKQTASEMVKNNVNKLSQLAYIQEAMKGYPDGEPNFTSSNALPIMSGGGVTGEKIREGKATYKKYIAEKHPAFNRKSYNEENTLKNEEGRLFYTYKDDRGNLHLWDSEEDKYVGFFPDENNKKNINIWNPNIEYYEVYKDSKPVDYQGPLLTKEQHKKIEASDEYKVRVVNFEKAILDNEDLQNDIYAQYEKLFEDGKYSNRKLSKQEVINCLFEQQRMGVLNDISTRDAYPRFHQDDVYVNPKTKKRGIKDAAVIPGGKTTDSKHAKRRFIDQAFDLYGFGYGVKNSDYLVRNLQLAFNAFAEVIDNEGRKGSGKHTNFDNNTGFFITSDGVDNEGHPIPRLTPVDDFGGNTMYMMNAYYVPAEPESELEKEEEESKTEKEDEEIKVEKDIVKPGPRYFDTWFLPDINNYVGAMTDIINRYEPAQGKVDLVTPGYVLADPTRQLAANQEQMAAYRDMLENSVNPQIALSATLGASGQGFQNAANVLANVENANVDITNRAMNQVAGIENQEIMLNEQMRQKYIEDMARLNQNYDEAKNLKKWRIIGEYNKGWRNFMKDQMMQNVLYPQVFTNNLTGEVFNYNFRNPNDPYQTYSPVYRDKDQGYEDPFAIYDQWLEKTGDPKLATDATTATIRSKAYYRQNNNVPQDYDYSFLFE